MSLVIVSVIKVFFPLRLYLTGTKQTGVVDSTFYEYLTMGSGTRAFSISGHSTHFAYGYPYDIKSGDSVTVYQKKGVRFGILLSRTKNGLTEKITEPTLKNILLNYDSFRKKKEYSFQVFLILSFFVFLFILIRESLLELFKEIRSDTQIESRKLKISNPDGKSIVISQIKSYIAPISYVLYAYCFLLLLLRLLLFLEEDRNLELIFGIAFSIAVALVIYTPLLIYSLKKYFKNTKSVFVKYILQILGLIISIFGIVKFIIFTRQQDMSDIKNFHELVTKLVSVFTD